MCCRNPGFNAKKLTLIATIFVALGAIVDVLSAYQEYCDSLNSKNQGTDNTTPIEIPFIL